MAHLQVGISMDDTCQNWYLHGLSMDDGNLQVFDGHKGKIADLNQSPEVTVPE
jgi:hypothetical protein